MFITINIKSIRSINLYGPGIFLVVIFALKNVALVHVGVKPIIHQSELRTYIRK